MFCKTCFAVVSLLLSIAGCASHPPRFIDGVMEVTQEHGVLDAKAQRISGWPCLRVNAVLLDRADRALAANDLGQAKSLAISLLDDAHRLAVNSAKQEFARLDDASWNKLSQRYFGVALNDDADSRTRLVAAFVTRTDQQHWFLSHAIEQSHDVNELRAILAPLRDSVQSAAKDEGRSMRELLLSPLAIPTQMVINSIRENLENRVIKADFQRADVYRMASVDVTRLTDRAEDWELLVRFAPTIFQENVLDVPYDAKADFLGQVVAPNADRVEIDTERPAVYAYARTLFVNGSDHKQLNYTLWYPEHPEAFPGDPEAGHIDGVTVRITLDRGGQVAFVETVANCGCYHGIYPASRLEAAARAEYGDAVPSHTYSIEREVPDAPALVVPGLLNENDAEIQLVFWCAAQQHLVMDVTLSHREPPQIVSERGYVLRPYDQLELLAMPNGDVTSMFYTNGLVKGAQRREGTLLAASGMLSAGQPRQRGTQLIHFDAYDLDDPRLLEMTLRLPSGF